MNSSEPLELAAKFLAPFGYLSVKNRDIWAVTYDVAIRRSMSQADENKPPTDDAAEKYLKAVQSLVQLQNVDPDSPALHVRLIHLKKTSTSYGIHVSTPPNCALVAALSERPETSAGAALDSAIARLWPTADLDPATYNSQYLQRRGTSSPVVLAAARALAILDAPASEIESTLFQVFEDHVEYDVKVMRSKS